MSSFTIQVSQPVWEVSQSDREVSPSDVDQIFRSWESANTLPWTIAMCPNPRFSKIYPREIKHDWLEHPEKRGYQLPVVPHKAVAEVSKIGNL